jgi:hypothetical protein
MRSALVCAFLVLGCSGPVDDPSQWEGTGGTTASGGDFSATGGETSSTGGSGGLEASTGGALVTGGTAGAPSGGSSSGGATGGSETGGVSSGGSSTGGDSSGGASTGGSEHYTTEAADCISNGTRYESADACVFIFHGAAGYMVRVNEAVSSWSCASASNGKWVTVSPENAAQVGETHDFIVYAPDELGECGIVCGEEKGVERKCTIPEGRDILGGSVDWEGEPRCYAQTVPPGAFTACTW